MSSLPLRAASVPSALLLAALLAPAAGAQTLLHTFDGNQANAAAGYAVTIAGDVDADGFDDILVGEPDFDRLVLPSTLLINAGRARLYSGRTGALIYSHLGSEHFEQLGYSVAGHGNVDGDEHADYVLGRPGADTGGGVTIIRGDTGNAFFQATQGGGGLENARFGHAVAFADVKNGPRTELLVGAPYYDAPGAVVDAGIVVYYSWDVVPTEAASFTDAAALQAGARFGFSLDDAGDWNGDNRHDVVVGAPGYNTGVPPIIVSDAGRVAVYARNAFNWVVLYSATGGLNPGRETGWSVAGVDDANGDGWPEIVVGGPGDDSQGADTGMAQLVYGPSGAASQVHFGEAAGDRYGERVAGIGDWDGDGRGDYAVGAPYHTAGVSPLLFDDGGRVEVRRGLNGALLSGFEGFDTGGRLGTGLGGGRAVGSGDSNADGRDEVVIGAPYDSVGGSDVGRVSVRTAVDLSASWDIFGTGLAGTQGVPALLLGNDPVIGTTAQIVMDTMAPGAVIAWIHLGFAQAAIPAKGGTLYVNPISSIPLPLPAGPTVLALAIPPDAALALGPLMLLQLTVPDAGAPVGWSFSQLLRIDFGY